MSELLSNLTSLLSNADITKALTGEVIPILRGNVETHGRQGWIKVYFSRAYKTPPQVIVTGSPGISNFVPKKVVFNKVSIPDVNIPIIDVSLPKASIPDIVPMMQAYIDNNMWSNTGNPIVDDPINAIRAPIILLLKMFAQIVGTAIDNLVNEYVEPRFKDVLDTIRHVIDIINNNIIGDASNPELGTINYALDKARKDLESTVNQIGDTMAYAVNHTIDYVYDAMGVIDNIPLAPVAVQNVTNSSFELYSSGGNYQWVAVGVFA